jgi:hypothetical protein
VTAMNNGKQYVVCVHNEGYEESLELRKIYELLDDPEAAVDGLLRVVDEDEDYLYPASWFRAIQVPQDVEAAFTELAAS